MWQGLKAAFLVFSWCRDCEPKDKSFDLDLEITVWKRWFLKSGLIHIGDKNINLHDSGLCFFILKILIQKVIYIILYISAVKKMRK